MKCAWTGEVCCFHLFNEPPGDTRLLCLGGINVLPPDPTMGELAAPDAGLLIGMKTLV